MFILKSQSLFQWIFPCNLILRNFKWLKTSRNPYFSGFSLAILIYDNKYKAFIKSQSLFQWIFPCNISTRRAKDCLDLRRNPYFSGFSLAINVTVLTSSTVSSRNPYFSGFSLAIMENPGKIKLNGESRNPYFSGFSLAILP